MKKYPLGKKGDLTRSSSWFKFALSNRWLIVFLLAVTALVAAPLVKQRAQTDLSSDAKEAAYRTQNGGAKQEVNEVSTIELPDMGQLNLPSNVNNISPAVGIDLGEEVEPNNLFTEANVLGGSEVKIRGDIFGNGDLDWYSFTANAGDRVYAAVMTSYSSSASTDSQLRIFASDGTTLIEFDDDDGSLGALSSTIAGAVLPAGRNILCSGQPFFGNQHTAPVRAVSQGAKRLADA